MNTHATLERYLFLFQSFLWFLKGKLFNMGGMYSLVCLLLYVHTSLQFYYNFTEFVDDV